MLSIRSWSLATTLLWAAVAYGAEAAEQDLLDALRANGTISEEQYNELLSKDDGQEDGTRELITTLSDEGLSIASPDEDFSLEIGGRLHADWTRHVDEIEPGGPIDGTNINRARVELSGRFERDWQWAAEADFAGNEVETKDFWLGYRGFDRLSLMVGKQKQPYNLALEMSSNDIPFVERSIDNALIEPFVDRATGIRAETHSEQWFVAAGAFGKSYSDALPYDAGWGASGRFVFAPLRQDERVVHLGLRTAYRRPENIDGILRLSADTTDFSDLSIVDTGIVTGVKSVTLFGPEVAAAFGPFLLLSEYNEAAIERLSAEDLDFDSWHISLAWAVGGESRAATYSMESGEFKRLDPSDSFRLGAGGGTWELAVRYASLNLNSGDFVGGREEALTLGGNWYPVSIARFMLDFTRIIETDESNAIRIASEGMDVVTLRAQFAF